MRRLRAPVLSIVQLAEANGVHHRNRPRAHGEDIAQDATDAGCRALERLDEARMIVGFDLECDRKPSPISMIPAFSPGPCNTCCFR